MEGAKVIGAAKEFLTLVSVLFLHADLPKESLFV
jgi:hypothetical protein